MPSGILPNNIIYRFACRLVAGAFSRFKVYSIVKSHKGDIEVRSELEKGTTFYVYLPLSDQRFVELPGTSAEILPTGTENILMVDDEPSIVKMQKQILEKLGYTVTARTSCV